MRSRLACAHHSRARKNGRHDVADSGQCRLTLHNNALLTQLRVEDLESFVNAPGSVPLEKKYELAVRASYLINAVANAARP